MESIDKHNIVFEEVKVSNTVVLLIHGITSSKEEHGLYTYFSEKLNQNGFSTFKFDFRGHGESKIPPDKIIISGMIADLYEVINYLESNYEKYSIVAASFGASILLLLIEIVKEMKKLNSVIFLNPVTNYQKTFNPEESKWASTFIPKGGLTGLLNYKKEIKIGVNFILNPLFGLELFIYQPNKVQWPKSIPLLTFHGGKDEIVSILDTLDYKRNQAPDMKLIEYAKGTHGLKEYKNELLNNIIVVISNT